MWKEFIKRVGVERVAAEIKVSRQTIYNYMDGSSEVPDKKKKELIKMSNGFLNIMDFFEE